MSALSWLPTTRYEQKGRIRYQRQTDIYQVNGSACSQNSHLINGILKDELGFQGFVMSDWLAQISGVASALAGLDMSMPGDVHTIPLLGNSYWMYEYSRSVLNGSIPVDRLNDAVTRILATWFKMGQVSVNPRPHSYEGNCLQLQNSAVLGLTLVGFT